MINIQIDQKTAIPVKIGELVFEIDVTDEKLDELIAKHSEVAELFEDDVPETTEEAKKVLKKAFDLFLGKGAFKKIYVQTPSIIGCVGILTNLLKSLPEELEKLTPPLTQAEKATQLVELKKKKKNRK